MNDFYDDEFIEENIEDSYENIEPTIPFYLVVLDYRGELEVIIEDPEEIIKYVKNSKGSKTSY